jgi:hypothetical protein
MFSFVLQRGPGKAMVLFGLAHIFILKVLGLRYVGLCSSASLKLPLLQKVTKTSVISILFAHTLLVSMNHTFKVILKRTCHVLFHGC